MRKTRATKSLVRRVRHQGCSGVNSPGVELGNIRHHGFRFKIKKAAEKFCISLRGFLILLAHKPQLIPHGMLMTCPGKMRLKSGICGLAASRADRLTPNLLAMALRVSPG